ncbi:MAG: winged helix-turn-helix domain-containing protein [Nitrososphaerales archaeon]
MEIIVNILEESRNGINKTRLVYRTNLNFLVVQKYIDFLTTKGLLQVEQRPNQVYVTTEKGLQFLNEFSKLAEILGVEQAVEYEGFL